jgi:hypothetical protein
MTDVPKIEFDEDKRQQLLDWAKRMLQSGSRLDKPEFVEKLYLARDIAFLKFFAQLVVAKRNEGLLGDHLVFDRIQATVERYEEKASLNKGSDGGGLVLHLHAYGEFEEEPVKNSDIPS